MKNGNIYQYNGTSSKIKSKKVVLLRELKNYYKVKDIYDNVVNVPKSTLLECKRNFIIKDIISEWKKKVKLLSVYYRRKFKRLSKCLKVSIFLYKRRLKQNWKFKKRKIIIKWSIIISLILLSFFTLRNKIQIIDQSTHTKEIIIVDTTNTLEQFLYQLRFIESSDNHKAWRPGSQFIGYYQLGNSARADVVNKAPMLRTSIQNYWTNPEIQHKYGIVWLISLKKYLQPEIDRWNNTFYGSFYLTESGIIAMAHIVGPWTTRQWLRERNPSISLAYRIVDGNGKQGTDYLQQLGRYNLNLDRFLDTKGNVNYKVLDNYVKKISNDNHRESLIIREILEYSNKYTITDTIDIKTDSISYKIFK
jgi:hypothetical protein